MRISSLLPLHTPEFSVSTIASAFVSILTISKWIFPYIPDNYFIFSWPINISYSTFSSSHLSSPIYLFLLLSSGFQWISRLVGARWSGIMLTPPTLSSINLISPLTLMEEPFTQVLYCSYTCCLDNGKLCEENGSKKRLLIYGIKFSFFLPFFLFFFLSPLTFHLVSQWSYRLGEDPLTSALV